MHASKYNILENDRSLSPFHCLRSVGIFHMAETAWLGKNNVPRKANMQFLENINRRNNFTKSTDRWREAT